MAGLPGLQEMRSMTKFGMSQLTLQFDDRTDIYRARQLVTERLQSAVEHLPHDVAPKLAPISTGLGEIFYYSVSYNFFFQAEDGIRDLTVTGVQTCALPI